MFEFVLSLMQVEVESPVEAVGRAGRRVVLPGSVEVSVSLRSPAILLRGA